MAVSASEPVGLVSHGSGVRFVLQSNANSPGSHESGVSLVLQSVSHSSGTPFGWQSGLVPLVMSQSSATPLLLQSDSQLSGVPFVLQSFQNPNTSISHTSGIRLLLQSSVASSSRSPTPLVLQSSQSSMTPTSPNESNDGFAVISQSSGVPFVSQSFNTRMSNAYPSSTPAAKLPALTSADRSHPGEWLLARKRAGVPMIGPDGGVGLSCWLVARNAV